MGGQHLPRDSGKGTLHGDQVDNQGLRGQDARGRESPREERGRLEEGRSERAGGFPKATPARRAKKRLPAATARPLKELKAGEVDHDAGEAAPCTRSHIPNARTRKALRDADAGKNLTHYVDADDLFRKLGIKLGQEKA